MHFEPLANYFWVYNQKRWISKAFSPVFCVIFLRFHFRYFIFPHIFIFYFIPKRSPPPQYFFLHNMYPWGKHEPPIPDPQNWPECPLSLSCVAFVECEACVKTTRISIQKSNFVCRTFLYLIIIIFLVCSEIKTW